MANKQLNKSEAINFFKNTEEGKAALGKLSPGEIGYGVAGAALGGSAGWLLSKILHRAPSTKLKLLYTLLGAAAGAGGTEYALSNISAGDGFDGTLKERLRLEPSFREALKVDVVPKGDGSGENKLVPRTYLDWERFKQSSGRGGMYGAGAGLLSAGILAYKGRSYDFSNLREARRLFNAAGNEPNVDAMQFMKGSWKYDPNLAMGASSSWTPGQRLLADVIRRDEAIDNSSWMPNRLKSSLRSNVSYEKQDNGTIKYHFSPDIMTSSISKAKDIGGNVAANVALGYGVGTGLDYLMSTINQDRPEYHRLLDPKTYKK